MRSCHGCFVKCKQAESSSQAQSFLMTDLILQKKDGALQHFKPVQNKCAFPPELGIAGSFPSGIKLLCVALPGEAWGRAVLEEELQPQGRNAFTSLPVHDGVTKTQGWASSLG